MLSKNDIDRLLLLLNDELKSLEKKGELYLVGGAVMCLVFEARPATKDLDGFFSPASVMREAAKVISIKESVDKDWLNDAVKGYLSPDGDYDCYLELSHLAVQVATAQYLLAMKCLSMRLAAEFHDEGDVRYLLRYLNISDYEQAVEVITKYYPLSRFPQKTLYALEEIFESN